jgi:hypothetical protein
MAIGGVCTAIIQIVLNVDFTLCKGLMIGTPSSPLKKKQNMY